MVRRKIVIEIANFLRFGRHIHVRLSKVITGSRFSSSTRNKFVIYVPPPPTNTEYVLYTPSQNYQDLKQKCRNPGAEKLQNDIKIASKYKHLGLSGTDFETLRVEVLKMIFCTCRAGHVNLAAGSGSYFYLIAICGHLIFPPPRPHLPT